MRAEGDDTGTRQRCNIDDDRWFESPRVSQRNSQEEKSLRVRIEHLEGLTRHALDDVTRFGGPATRQVFNVRDDHNKIHP